MDRRFMTSKFFGRGIVAFALIAPIQPHSDSVRRIRAVVRTHRHLEVDILSSGLLAARQILVKKGRKTGSCSPQIFRSKEWRSVHSIVLRVEQKGKKKQPKYHNT